MVIEIKGEIVNDDYGPWYEWLGFSCSYPKKVTTLLKDANGEDITVKINSPGGDIFAASDIYTELRDYKGNVKIIITGMAASAGSVIAMAGKNSISPTGQIMVHNVSTGAYGDYREMDHTSDILKNANDTIANAYMCKTGMTREQALELMNNETYLSAEKAKQIGLVDEILFEDENKVKLSNLSNIDINKLYNSVSAKDILINMKNSISNNNHPLKSKKKDDFFMQQNKAKLELLKLKGGVL